MVLEVLGHIVYNSPEACPSIILGDVRRQFFKCNRYCAGWLWNTIAHLHELVL